MEPKPKLNHWKDKNGRFCLELNSHSLSYFQICEQRYKYSEIQLLNQKEEYYPFKRGAGISAYLQLWYMAKKKGYTGQKLEKLEDHLMKKMARSASFVNSKWNEDDRMHIATRLVGYFQKYRNENYPIIAIEKGFSKIIYEDQYVLFVYSGRPDLVLNYGRVYGIGPMDHKSESRENDIITFNNQFIGYCWALNARVGMVNYIGLQKDPGKDQRVLRREAFSFSDSQIKKWENDTIKWFFRIRMAVAKKEFLRSWRCDGKYGACLYLPLCSCGTLNEERIKIKRDFIKLPAAYRSW